MGVIQPVLVANAKMPVDLRDCDVVTWASITDADTCAPIQTGATFRNVQIFGTYGGATITLTGSNDATIATDGTYIILKDVSDAAISKTTGNVLEQIGELTRWIKPTTASGTNSNMTVTLFLVK